jgi:hypothetical protein
MQNSTDRPSDSEWSGTSTLNPPPKKTLLWILGLSALFLTFFSIPQFIKLMQYCLHNYDIGIYSQAIQRLSWDNLNPKLTVLPFKIFNDHVDPIIFLPAFLAKVFNPAFVVLTFEHVFYLLAAIPMIMLYRAGRIDFSVLIFLISYIWFNKGAQEALHYPGHPTTWTVLPLTLMGFFSITRNTRGLFWSTLLLFTFKEEFPFIGVMLTGYWIWQKEKKYAISMGSITLLWLMGVFFLRPLISEGIINQHSSTVFDVVKNPLILFERYTWGEIKHLFKVFIPLAPLFFMNLKQSQNWKSSLNWACFFAIVPIFAIRFISGKWGFHYTAPFATLLAFLFIAPRKLSSDRPPLAFTNSKVWILSMILLFGIGVGGFTKGTHVLLDTKNDTCPRDPKRLKSIQLALEIVGRISGQKNILAQGNLVPPLVKKNVYQTYASATAPSYQYFVSEKGNRGDPHPAGHEKINRLTQKIRALDSARVLHEDPYVVLIEAQISQTLINSLK